MKRFIGAALFSLLACNASAVTIDFESVAGLTPLNTDTAATPLPAASSIVAEIPGLVISSLGPTKNAVISTATVRTTASAVFPGWISPAPAAQRIRARASSPARIKTQTMPR